MHVDPHGADPGCQGIFKHIPGQSGVLANDDTVAVFMVFDQKGDSPPDLHGDFRGHGMDVGHPPDAVGAEKLSHMIFLQRVRPRSGKVWNDPSCEDFMAIL